MRFSNGNRLSLSHESGLHVALVALVELIALAALENAHCASIRRSLHWFTFSSNEYTLDFNDGK